MLVVVCMNVEDTLIKAWTKIEDRTCLLQGERVVLVCFIVLEEDGKNIWAP